jgi:hypothetical protein
VRNPSRKRDNRTRYQKIGKRLRQQAKQRKKESRSAKQAAA